MKLKLNANYVEPGPGEPTGTVNVYLDDFFVVSLHAVEHPDAAPGSREDVTRRTVGFALRELLGAVDRIPEGPSMFETRKTPAELRAADPDDLTGWEQVWRRYFLRHPTVITSWRYQHGRDPHEDELRLPPGGVEKLLEEEARDD